ncbi:MAG: F0F1 ATP synthase subunit beta, partial [Fuerstiella sp.]|nr:F0F1 ATP synthase subunit beta [Fuerstiella sp.]
MASSNIQQRDQNRSGIVVEVVSQLNEVTIRGIALTPTRGLSRGASISDTGHSLRVPVGQALL